MFLTNYRIIFILLLSYVCYNIFSLTDYFKKVSVYNDNNCYNINGPIGIEDIVHYKHYLIGGSNQYLPLFTQDNSIHQTDNGQMIALNTKTNQLFTLPIVNFPSNVPFHPHGLYLYHNKYIYVINHSITEGERVEVLEILYTNTNANDNSSALVLQYDHSIILPHGFNEITNDLVVINTDEFYITTSYILERDNKRNKIKRVLFEITNALSIMFKINLAYTYHYKNNTMSKVLYSNGLFNNGIEYDEDNNLLFIAQTLNKRIRVLEIDNNSNSNINNGNRIKFNRDIYLDYALDNIHYDINKSVITAGVIGNVYYSIQFSKLFARNGNGNGEIKNMYGGAIEINLKNHDEITLLIMAKEDKMKAITSAIVINDKVYLSSFGFNGLLVCLINSNTPPNEN